MKGSTAVIWGVLGLTAFPLWGQSVTSRTQPYTKSLPALHPTLTHRGSMPMHRMGVHPKYKAKKPLPKPGQIKPLNPSSSPSSASKAASIQAAKPLPPAPALNSKNQALTVWGKKSTYPSLYQKVPAAP